MSEEQRTIPQNSAIHLFCERLANSLNDGGFDMKHVLQHKPLDVPWSMELVKEALFKAVVKAMFNKDSTTELTTKEVSQVYDTLDRFTAEKFGVHVEWPSNEDKYWESMGVKR